MHSSSHLIVRSTEVLFLFSDTQVGTSSAKVAHRFGLNEEISSMYSTGLTWKHTINLEIFTKLIIRKLLSWSYSDQEAIRANYQKTTARSLKWCSNFVCAVTLWKALNRVPCYSCKSIVMQTKHLMKSSNIWYRFWWKAFQTAELNNVT